MEIILIILGALLVIEGLPYFAFPGKVKEWSLVVQGIPSRSMRAMGAASIGAGLILLYIVRYF